jgi:small-conductance mechanosensitive channel
MLWTASKLETESNLKSPKRPNNTLTDEDLRMFEATEIASDVIEYNGDSDDIGGSSSSSFDWDKGQYCKGTIWVATLFQILIGTILTVLGLFLSNKFEDDHIEVIRACIQLGIPVLTYGLMQLLFIIIPLLALKIARMRGKLYPGLVTRLRIDRLLKLRRSIGMVAFGIVASFLSLRLYPNNSYGAKADNINIANPVLAFGADMAKYITSHHPDFFVTRFFISWLAIAIIVLIETAFVDQIGVMFHAAGLAKREKANRVFRKITKSLCKYFVENERVRNPAAPPGELIFDAIGKTKLNAKDFLKYMDEDEAEIYFLLLDEEGGGKGELDRDEFVSSVARLQNEEKAIEKALLNNSGLIQKLDRLMMLVVIILSSVLVLAIFESPITIVFSYLVSLIASIFFLFGSVLKTLFDSITYVILNHPFDQDDWLILGDGNLYQVKEIGLLTSSFLTPQNDLVYMNNLSLNSQAVVNLKRSSSMSEVITLNILPETSKAKIAQLEHQCIEWLKNQPHIFLPQFSFFDFQVTDNLHMRFKMRLWHRANFDDMTKKDHRSRLFMLFLKEIMSKIGIQTSPPVLPGHVKY